ncbi:MAG: cation transporter [Clostridiales bacterium]|nr:cation transporter [Clostridiales bacterium]
MIKTTLEIEGMSCGMCESHINETIRRAFSVKSVKSSHKKNRTEILSENPMDEQELKKAISATGYEVLGVKSEEYEKKSRFGRK